MLRRVAILGLLLVVIAVPFLLQKRKAVFLEFNPKADTLVVLCAHNESVGDEFNLGFQKWYQEKTGRSIRIDFRYPGGLVEAVRLLDNLYENSFRLYWERALERPWTTQVANAFCQDLKLSDDRSFDNPDEAVRRAFLDAPLSVGIDVFFGGGIFEFKRLASRGYFEEGAIWINRIDEYDSAQIPEQWYGNALRDAQSKWIGTVFTGFGLVYNKDVLARIEYPGIPRRWVDVTAPCFLGKVALCDPTKSGSSRKAFEIIIQEEMFLVSERLIANGMSPDQARKKAQREGWLSGLKIIQKLGANAQYFTDKSTKPTLDVSAGDSAVGMAVDYYGIDQAQSVFSRSGTKRVGYTMPTLGSPAEADPIALLRGAPQLDAASLFLQYVLSMEGQKIWMFEAGTPGGPQEHTLGRAAILQEMYDEMYLPYRVEIGYDPYRNVQEGIYDSKWTANVFSVLNCVIEVLCMDPHPELVDAWQAIIQAQKEGRIADAQAALIVMENMDGLDYDAVAGPLKETLVGRDPSARLAMQTALSSRFIAQYKKAKMIATRRH
jgi:iron(III) transport system substrate-binding protein